MGDEITHAIDTGFQPLFDGQDEARMQELYKSRTTVATAEQLTTGSTTLEEQLTAEINEVYPTEQLTAVEQNERIDLVLKDNSDLINPEWKGWHVKKIKQRGIDFYVKCCKTARSEGKDPKRCLTWLLNQA